MKFMKQQHPTSGIQPDAETIKRIMATGWVGQKKINGRCAQIHVAATGEVIAYTRHGDRHTLPLSQSIQQKLVQHFAPSQGFNVIVGEWQPTIKMLFTFDTLAQEGERLDGLTFPERFKLLPRDFIDPEIQVLPLIKTLAAAMKVFESEDPYVEGMVFKSSTSKGWPDSAIIRCRRKK